MLQNWLESIREWAGGVGLSLTSQQEVLLHAFEADLYETNATRNLTRVAREEFWVRHVADSLLFHDLLPSGSSVLDIGSGPGFPAWPLAWARPDLSVTALDSSSKMTDFLRRHPLPNLEVVQMRAEDWNRRDAFDVVTGRAVAPLAIQLELSAAACRRGGAVLPMRTESDLDAIEALDPSALGLSLKQIVQRYLPVIGAVRVFPIYEKVRSTPARFPRPWAEIRRAPLSTGTATTNRK